MSDAMEDIAAELLQPTPASLDTSELPQAKAARLPRQSGLWAATSLNDLTDRSLDELYPARLRLLLLLTILTRRGKKSIHLPNATVKTIGLDRQQKHVCLKYLEAHGFVRVEQEGQNSSIVTLLDWRTLRGQGVAAVVEPTTECS